MKIVICDDDPKITEELYRYIREYFKLSGIPYPEVVSHSSGDKLLEAKDYGDIVFLDVEMPGQSGICVGRKLMKIKPHTKVIILTNYPEYLDEAMDFRVFRYLSKPIDKSRLFRNLKSAIKQYMEENSTIEILTKDSLIACNTQEIICVQYNNRKTIVYTTTEKIESLKGMDHWKSILTTPCFFQTHRSYIINLEYVRRIDRFSVTLNYGQRTVSAYLTARKYNDAINKYLQYRGRYT